MVGPHPPAVGGLANNMSLLMASSMASRFRLIPVSTAKRRKHTFPNRPHWDSLPYLFLSAAQVLAAVVRHRPDAVYLKATSDTGFLRDIVLILIARALGRPVLCHLHGRPRGTTLFAPTPNRWRRLAAWGMARTQVTVVLSPGLARQFASFFPGHPLVPVPNVVDVRRFSPGAGDPDGPMRVLFVGRLSEEKGIRELIETAARLRAEGVSAHFRLCGLAETADEERRVREEVAHRGLSDTVEFLGVVRGEALAAEYTAADVFFLPTHAEIFPNVVLEALASGLPVVTTDVPVIPEMFTEGAQGFRTRPGDVARMTDILTGLAADAERRRTVGAAARALAEEAYDVEVAARRIGDLLERLARGAPVTGDALNVPRTASS